MTKLRSSKTLGVALGCVALLFVGIAAGRPHRTVPIDGTFGTTFKLTPTATPGVFDCPIQGVGDVRRLGPCTLVIAQTVDFRNTPPTLDSELVLTFADGDQLNATSQGTGTPHEANPAFFKLAGEGIITGGTGRFQNATGVVRFPGVAHVDTPPDVSPAEGHGTFALEGFVRFSRH
jgi:hypothetical protein